jgi:hypothetical protein
VDDGEGESAPPTGSPDDCKDHVALGGGWDFSYSTEQNKGLSLAGGDRPGEYMHGDFGDPGTLVTYPSGGAAQAVWVR